MHMIYYIVHICTGEDLDARLYVLHRQLSVEILCHKNRTYTLVVRVLLHVVVGDRSACTYHFW